MTDTMTRAFGQWKRNRPAKVSIDPRVSHERPVDVDPRTLYDEEIERDTRNVRLDISFGDVIHVRDEAQIIRDSMDEIIAITRRKDYDDVTARRWARRQASALARALARMNGKTPRKPT